MILPNELKQTLPMELSDGIVSTTTYVWEILLASRDGDLQRVKELVDECPGLIYAQYNYAPPIHFAVREGHLQLVEYLLDHGAHDPSYKVYPFLDSLPTIAEDRGHAGIAHLLEEYNNGPARWKFNGDNGRILRPRTTLQSAFESAVDKGDLDRTAEILKSHPAFAKDESYFWGEGILAMPAHDGNHSLIELLMSHGAKVPDILKWTQFYYFEKYATAEFLMDKGMNPDVMSWHGVRILHDMAQKGDLLKAKLLIAHGADIDPLEDEYQSTPLGLAARWGRKDMVEYLLSQGADPHKSGAPWSTPLAWARKKGHAEIEKMLLSAG
jgi:ankyrin repeat protein